VPGSEYFLTSGTDSGADFTGTENDDTFNAYIAQNPLAGGISNTLSSADRLDGGMGSDRLYAEVTSEFVGLGGGAGMDRTDIQPRLNNIEEIDIEARDAGGYQWEAPIVVDAKNISDHVEIGSYFSDGDLVIENVTTLVSNGDARDTSEITVTMDHTDNFNSDYNASDLTVKFDNDYLLSGETSEGIAEYFLLDETAELLRMNGMSEEGRMDEIDRNGIRFEINGEVVDISFDPALLDETNPAEINDHAAFVAALQADLTAKIADGTLPADTKIELIAPTGLITDATGKSLNRTGLNDGTLSELIPAIRVTSGDGSPITPLGYVVPDELTGAFDVFGEFRNEFETEVLPISIDIDLHKAGRGGEGGDLIVGGKAQNVNEGIAGGIEVFNISVKGVGGEGADAKPSNVGTITSTLGALHTVNIVTDPDYADGDSFASLVVRNGFDENPFGDTESGDLQLVNANGFLGNLTLGDVDANNNAGRIVNLDTLNAMGGGNVEFNATLDGNETNEMYTYTTAGGNDKISVNVAGDALDYADAGLRISTNGGNDKIDVQFAFDPELGVNGNNQLNQAVLDNVLIDGGSGDDTISVDGVGVANILGGSGNDTIYTDGGTGSKAVWAFNFDQARADAAGGIGAFAADDLPGSQLNFAYIGGAEITVNLSGAGEEDNWFAGGGVMVEDDDRTGGAWLFDSGYEKTVTISELVNGNDYYGDQRDVNLAVVRAINEDPVLSKLLVASIEANNTLVVKSLTSGDFVGGDLKLSIDQLTATTDAVQDAVVAEAQAIWQNSNIDADTLFDGADEYREGAPAWNEGDSLELPEGNLNEGQNRRDNWYEGLSRDDRGPATGDNLHTSGTADITEKDKVIDGGEGDDVIVLSTDAIEGPSPDFNTELNRGGSTTSKALMNGASNETIVLTGQNFGNDTVMNFQTANGEDVQNRFVGGAEFNIDDDADTLITTFINGTGFVVMSNLTVDGSDIEVSLAGSPTSASIAGAVVAAINANPLSGFVASLAGSDTVRIDSISSLEAVFANFVIEDRTASGFVTNTFPADPAIATRVDEQPVVTFLEADAGLDFLDFTEYLTSQFDASGDNGGSSVSNQLIEVDLGNNSDASPSEVEANDVVVITYDPDTAADFDGLDGLDIAALFNNDDGTGDYDGMSDNDFNVSHNQTDEDLVGGVGKAILMVENEDNDGEYKVFELTWDGSEDDGDEGVMANLLGSLDFGSSLQPNLGDVNIVGTEDYIDLLQGGF
jgi:hypothetical protein